MAPAVVHQRIGFAASMINGRTVLEQAGNPRSPAEIAELWRFLKARLARQRRNGIAAHKATAAKARATRSVTKKAA